MPPHSWGNGFTAWCSTVRDGAIPAPAWAHFCNNKSYLRIMNHRSRINKLYIFYEYTIYMFKWLFCKESNYIITIIISIYK